MVCPQAAQTQVTLALPMKCDSEPRLSRRGSFFCAQPKKLPACKIGGVLGNNTRNKRSGNPHRLSRLPNRVIMLFDRRITSGTSGCAFRGADRLT